METNRKWHSCRLTVHGDSGRVRWCVGHERNWQAKLKRLVFLPAILLSAFFIYVLITHVVIHQNESQKQEFIEKNTTTDNRSKREVNITDKKQQCQTGTISNDDTSSVDLKSLSESGDGYGDVDGDGVGDDKTETLFEILDKYEGHLIFWAKELKRDEIRRLQAKLMRRYIDENVHPCDDFYKYACGNWQKYNPIPPEKATFDTFEILRQNLESVIKYLVENGSDQSVSSNKIGGHQLDASLQRQIFQQRNRGSSRDAILKAKYLYKSCMNQEILNYRGVRPLLDLLGDLGGWPMIDDNWKEETFDVIRLMGQLRRYNNDILISQWVGPDIKNSKEYVIQIDQTTLGLPSREYFLDKSNARYIEAYRDYIVGIAQLLGAQKSTAVEDTDDIIDFETQLAMIVAGPESRKNVTEIYIKLSIEELHDLIPEISWPRYFDIVMQRRINLQQTVVCFSVKYLKDLVRLLERTPSRTVSNYLFWRFVKHRINNLDDRFDGIKQKFYHVLFGREKSPPRWQTCVAQVNSNLGMVIGGMFVEKFFDEDSKNDTMQMTKQLQESFRSILYNTNWLDDNTKILARLKIDNMRLRIGYPDFVLSKEALAERYLDIRIHPDYYFENTLSVLKHLTRLEQSRLGTTVNKSLWNTPPAVVNAYYSRNKNQIMFPAGILQPPFYHKYFPRSVNYGGIGVVIGHEITHGFDDKGRLFDRQGNLQRWWNDVSIEEFHARARCLVAQYNSYTIPEINETLDGFNTQGENIADNGGLKQAFKAYNRWLEENPEADETLPGLNFTSQQLFFLNFAQVWCGSSRPQASRNKLKTAVHSPGRFRVIGALTNFDEFSKTYNCPLGSPMNPPSKCRIW